jgi:hypothetical protein
MMQIRAKNFVVVDAPARMKKVFAVIPTDNIAGNLPHWMAELFSLEIPHLKIIIVDDASSDGTGEIAETFYSNGFFFQVEMAYLAERTGQRVKETPIDFQEQQKSDQVPAVRIELEAIWRAVQLNLRYREVHLARDSATTRQSLFD